MKFLKGKLKLLITAIQIMAAVFFLIQPALATTIDSANYRILDYNFGQGGETSTSTNFSLSSSIDLVIDAQRSVSTTTTPPGGGGETPPPIPPDTTPAVISNVRAINITLTSAIIAWDTNEAADSSTEYGLDALYGLGSVSSSTLTVSHALYVSGLTADTLYHFRVKSKDASNNEAVSGDYTFKTLKEADITPPVISNIRVENITGTSASILWDTNEPASSSVKYGLTSQYGLNAASDVLIAVHAINLQNLTPDTEYHFQVLSTDASGNTAISSDQIFRTLDTIPPVISNIQVLNITERSADITWVTNEGTTSQILYRRSGAATWLSAVDNGLQVSHFQTLSNLIGNADYEFYIIANDAAGNQATSQILSFKTLKDNIPPSNVRNFTATPDDKLNVLTWQNPADADYAGVVIVRNTSGYPNNRFDGDVIYVGQGISFNDFGLTNGVTYYYTAFAFDTSENFASGAITQGTPSGEIPPTEEVPIPPIEEIPTPPAEIVPAVNLDAVSFWAASRTIKLQADSSGKIETLAGIGLGISVDKNKLPEAPKVVTLRVENSNYLMKLRSSGDYYDADISLPTFASVYKGEVTLTFEKSQAIIKFTLDLKQKGMVFEIIDGRAAPFSGAAITLYELRNNIWQIWNASPYYQINPLVADGSYGFLVPNGTYYLKVLKDGYRDNATNRFEVTKNYINQNLELFLKPKKLIEVINPEASITENIMAIVKNIAEKINYGAKIAREDIVKFVQNPVVEDTTSNIAAPSLLLVAVANVATAIPMLSFWTYLQYLLTQPFLFLKRKKRKAWGVVYNAFTKMPIDLAIVRLLDASTKRIVRTVVTDKQGRYILFAPQGKFILQITKAGFQFPSAYLKGKKEDEAFVDLYYGETFEIKQESQPVAYNIPMDPAEKKVSLRRMVVSRALKGLQFGLALSGIALTTVALIIAPSLKIGAFLAIHIVLFALFLRLARPAKFNKWGIVKDENGKPVRNAIVRLFEPEYNKLLGTQITDSKGHYAFLVGRNIYYLTFEKAGYKSVKTKNIDMRTKAKAAIITEKVQLAK